jgi:hypothetical protein
MNIAAEIICSALNYAQRIVDGSRPGIPPPPRGRLVSAAVSGGSSVLDAVGLRANPKHTQAGGRADRQRDHKPPRRIAPPFWTLFFSLGRRRRAQLGGSGTGGSCKLNSGDCTTVVRSG